MAKASLLDLQGLLPDSVNVGDNPDFLYFAANGAIAGAANANGDSISVEKALEIYPLTKNKYINVDHKKEIVVGTLLSQGCLWYLATKTDRPIKAMQFSIGNGRVETSAHFIPADPLIKYMLANQASNIITKEPFFIGNVVDFYKTFTPALLNKPNIIEVNYEVEQLGDGYSKKLILRH